jgi:hypothetical protein
LTSIICDSKVLGNAINDIMLKGKYGEKTSSLGNQILLESSAGAGVFLWNADPTCIARLELPVAEITGSSVSCAFDGEEVLKYLRKIKGEITLELSHNLSISADGKVTLPLLREHSHINTINNVKKMDFVVDSSNSNMPSFNGTPFEARCTVVLDGFKKSADMCDLIGGGYNTLDFKDGNLRIFSQNGLKSYNQQLTVEQNERYIGEDATVSYTGPLHKFFNGNFTLHLRDEFPLLLLNEERFLIRAPHNE